MITFLLTIGIIYLAFWFVINLVGIVLKVAFFPIRLIVGIILGILGFVFVTPFVIFLIIPAVILLILWSIGRVILL